MSQARLTSGLGCRAVARHSAVRAAAQVPGAAAPRGFVNGVHLCFSISGTSQGCSIRRLGVPHLNRPVVAVVPSAQAGGAAGGGSGSIGGSGGSSGGGSSGGGSGAAGGSGDGTPHPLRNWTWAYAAFLAVGGTFAFIKAGSQKSFTSAMGAALILALSGRKMLVGSARGSIAVCLAISVFLSIIMAGRYSRSRKVMPAGMTAAASIGMSAAYIFSLIA